MCIRDRDRVLIPSPKVATYDLQPEMSAPEVCAKAVELIESQKYDVMILNFANCDMVGHTGIFEAAVKACLLYTSLLCLRGKGGGGNIIACRLHICFDGLLHEPYNRVEPVNGAQYKHQQAYDCLLYTSRCV